MGQEISKIAYNEDYVDLSVVGLSPTQVGLIREHFLALAGRIKSGEARFGAKQLAVLLGIPQREAQLIVDFADLDGDGCLNDYEFICLIGLFTQGTLEDKLVALFSLFDSDLSQLISLEEMTQLVRCVLGVNEGGKEPTEAQVSSKIADIQETLFSTEPQIRLADFVIFAQEDEDFKVALKTVGVISESEFRSDFNNDLEAELNRIDDDGLREDPEAYQGKRYGMQAAGEDGLFEAEEVGAGDQFMAVKPFLGVVKNSVPSNFDPSKANSSIPNAGLELEHVHGYRCFDTRNNLRWVNGDNVLFHTAAVAAVLNCETNRQKFNLSNTDDIIALDKHNKLVATAQIGHKPIINLWDCSTMETRALIGGRLEKGISHVAFSHSGTLLVGCAMNDDHDLAVYDISDPATPVLFAQSKGVKDVVLDLKFAGSPTANFFFLATQKGLYVVDVLKGSLKIGRASGWGTKGPQACLTVGFLTGMDAVVGLQSGELASIKGRSITKTVAAHKGPVFATCNDTNYQKLFTGGADGQIIIWESGLIKSKTIDLAKEGLGVMMPKVRALAFEESSARLLVGARSGDVLELSTTTPGRGRVLLRGHHDRELWGLCVHPSNEEYATCGEDFVLAKWSVTNKKQIAAQQMKFQAKTLDICPKGRSLAVGCTNGTVSIFEYASFKETKTLKPSAKEISIVRFSPESTYLAVGCHDACIYLFNVANGYKRQAVCKGHHSTITHLDFSKNGSVLMSNCTSYEILYWNTENGKQDTKGASANRDEEWASWTCTLGWPVQGVFPPCADGSDVNSVDRHRNGGLIASGDDFGKVNLFRYPCLKDAAFLKFVGHSSHVTGVKFTANGKHLISVGGNDKSVFQWRLEEGDAVEPAFEDLEVDATEFVPRHTAPAIEAKKPAEESGLFEEMEDEAGDQFMAVKPFVGDLKKSIPSDFNFVKGMEDPPEGNLDLLYVHGYRCFDARNTARFSTTSKSIVFASAALGVELAVEQNTQSFFRGHEEDIISFDLHPSREIAATGQMAMKGKSKLIDIFVWRVSDKSILANLKGFHLRAVQLLRFTPDGTRLLSFGQDDDNSLAVYDWAAGVLLTTSKVDKTNVLDCAFTAGNQFLTSGTKHLKFWTLNGANAAGKNVSWTALKNKSEAVVGVCGLEGGLAVGGSWSGSLLLISGGSVSSALKAHDGPVYVLHYAKHIKKFYSGGKDGAVHEFQVDGGRLKLLRTVFKLSPTESLCPGIRVIDTLKENMLVGTMASELYTVENFVSSAGGKKTLVMSGHFKGELWGLACHPSQAQYATCGDDETLRTWSVATRRMLACQHTKVKLRGLDYSPDGKFIVTASMCGKVLLFDSDLKKELQNYQSNFKSANHWIEDIKFSPNGQYVAFGAHGGASKLEVLAFDGKTLKAFASINCGLTSALLHVDWSEDSGQLVVNSQAYELKFVDLLAKKQVAASAARDTNWSSWTCKLGFPVQGIFPGVDGTDVNTVARSANRKVLATGDDFQLVKLFKYPSVQPKSGFKSYVAHASHVTRVRFMLKDSFLVSTGGNDKTNMLWTTDFGADPSLVPSVPKMDRAPSGTENADATDEDLDDLVVQRKVAKHKYGKDKNETAVIHEHKHHEGHEEGGLFEEEVLEEGTEFMAVKPWLGAIKPPSSFSASNNLDLPPNVDVTLEYAHGYRSKDCRNNLFWADDALYYHTAALAVRLDYSENTQRFFDGQRDDIISMAFCRQKNIFATAEIGPKPKVFLWSANSMAEVTLLKGGAIKGVCTLAFSPSGNKLAGACIDDNHHVVLYDTTTFELIACEKGDTASILACAWMNESEFVTVGLRHYKLWNTAAGLKSSRGSFGQNNDKLLCCQRFKNSILVGTITGELQVWSGTACGKSLKIHTGALDAIYVSASERVFTGGKDKRVSVLDSNLVFLTAFNLNELITDGLLNEVRALTLSQDETQLFVGTAASELHRLSAAGAKFTAKLEPNQIAAEQLMAGHYARNAKWTNEVWALASLSDDRYLTASDDGTLRLWSGSQRKQLKVMKLNIDAKGCQLAPDKTTGDLAEAAKLRSVTACQEDRHVAVGCKEGTLRIIDLAAWKQIHLIKRRRAWISELRYSPNNEFLAVGSHDDIIDIYIVNQKYKLLYAMKKHSSFITHLDWSVDSNYLHSNCGAYELLFWDVRSGKQLTAGASGLRDEQWETWSCVLGWPVQGIFQPEWDGSDINMVDRSHNETSEGNKIIAAGDDFSTIRLYRYPCLRKTAKAIILYGHSSHVTNVKFSPKDEYLYSTGGEDHTVLQWKLRSK